MVVELVAGRLLAPYVGVSLYTWTSVIGVVLAGISLGNFAGGLIADRYPSARTLGILFGLSSLATLGVLASTAVLGRLDLVPSGIGLQGRTVLVTATLFFLPSAMMGTITPVVVKLTLRDLARTGHLVGRIYACGALGSIAGTFLTGFWLISLFGTRKIVLGVALVLLLLALATGDIIRRRRVLPRIELVGAALLVLGFAASWRWLVDHGRLIAPCTLETNYYCIRVDEQKQGDGRLVRRLVLDHLIHSYADINDPTYLQYGYESIFADITAYTALKKGASDLSTLFIGGGGYTYPRYVESIYRGSTADVLEIDPGVTLTAELYLGLAPGRGITTHYGDARTTLQTLPRQHQYDLIFGDAFNDLSVPYHLTTKEFDVLVEQALSPGGYYVANVIDNYQKGQFVKAFLRTLHLVFPYVYLLADGRSWNLDAQNTYIVVGSDRPFSDVDFAVRLTRSGRGMPITQRMPPEQLAHDLAAEPRIVLTDDYVPVDNLLAPLFDQRGF